MNKIQRFLLEEGIKKNGVEKSKQISREVCKEQFIAMVLIVPTALIILIFIGSFIAKEQFIMESFYAFPSMLVMWLIVSLSGYVQENRIIHKMKNKIELTDSEKIFVFVTNIMLLTVGIMFSFAIGIKIFILSIIVVVMIDVGLWAIHKKSINIKTPLFLGICMLLILLVGCEENKGDE